MSANKRANINDNDKENLSDNNTDESNSSDNDDLMGEDSPFEVQVEFEGRVPIDPDHDGIAQLLQRLFLKERINCRQLADLIIEQNFVGSVIVQSESDPDDNAGDGDDDDANMIDNGTIFGITTVLNITAKKEKPCIAELRAFILDKAEKHANDAALKHFRSIFNDNEDHQIGYLINERFINIPLDISVPLLDNLYKETKAAEQKGMKFKFDYYIMILKFHRKETKKNKEAIEDIYVNIEEELINEIALNSFEWSIVDECNTGEWSDGDDTLTPYRKIIVFDAKELPGRITTIDNYIKNIN